MAIQQDIVLNFKTNLEQAKTSIGELATLHQQSLIPQGQPGALDDTQKAEVESLVTQRAQDKGISLDDTKKVLTEIAAIEEQINALSIGRVEREQKISELNEKAGAAAANRILQENKAKELVGLTAKATREQLEAKITALKIGKNLNISEEERVKQLEEVDKLLKSAQSYGGVATRNSNKAVELANEQAMALQTQEDAFARIAVIGKEITLNAEELDTLITYTTKGVIDRNKAEKQNTKEKEKAVKLAQKETQETEDLNRLLETQPDNFAKRAISAVIYYEALNQLKRIARAAVNTIKDLDRALTDIAVVTSMTRQES